MKTHDESVAAGAGGAVTVTAVDPPVKLPETAVPPVPPSELQTNAVAQPEQTPAERYRAMIEELTVLGFAGLFERVWQTFPAPEAPVARRRELEDIIRFMLERRLVPWERRNGERCYLLEHIDCTIGRSDILRAGNYRPDGQDT